MTTYENLTRPGNASALQRFTDPATWGTFGAQWHSGEQKTLQCCAVRQETHDVKTFIFRCADFSALSFEPGQFITISPVIGGQTIARCYTLSSSPTRPFAFSITVKRVPGGAVSNWLHDHLKPGDNLKACGPAGSFTPVGHPATKLLYLSAGSGVTPLMSMTRAACDMAGNLDIVFVHSARTPTDIIFHGELTRMQAAMPGLRVISVCEGLGDTAQWQQPIGRLDLSLLSQHVPDYQEREIFTCGPQGYMEAVKSLLREAAFDFAHYHQESFDIAALNEEPLIEQAASLNQQDVFTVTLSRSGKTFSMPGNQTVLSAARKAGAIVPSSCSQGICGTCKTALLQGTVDMHHNGGIRQREIDKGLRLLCCSKPTSDLVLDL
ncbi:MULTISPECIES: hybrid-cluster NAD(P)-dependent oxidoreductase [unclassified Pseudomonas]|uniref:hybrid-cluster NAD(P)-dependent oxidoreductase n=1 Tax=unclassified Pseudomonas TaxID=196821 RepID=UPI000CD0CC93|nr:MULTISPECIES: hybrid-cluster NAD(P)-dependent oxidoreductase [unclassified Pseudomonas]POA13195.1 hybrid-cluster NAD(P)-dependent oxidoreductase [Pseudomonas sp. MPBD7-1]